MKHLLTFLLTLSTLTIINAQNSYINSFISNNDLMEILSYDFYKAKTFLENRNWDYLDKKGNVYRYYNLSDRNASIYHEINKDKNLNTVTYMSDTDISTEGSRNRLRIETDLGNYKYIGSTTTQQTVNLITYQNNRYTIVYKELEDNNGHIITYSRKILFNENYNANMK
ncbi:hypothetical protein [Apibacter adventoris]|uniref:Uncharacterized protein n=1 Tax=Apibacter adventoris TaxID=1679466 RepID=A0A2S8AAQ6_9FLAO|nr:hypothetical protein [Apibacter adventoris]PQL91676.1 hypothetical protein C4S77_07700 [Apibacter adventoris]